MRAEFEEKQFEQALNFELVSENRFLYTPGQYLENILGFDAAIFTSSFDFWNLFPKCIFFRCYCHHHHFSLYPAGIELRKEMWNELETEIDNEDFFPQIKFNLFIQHKRPEYLNRRNAAEWNYWNCPYFRYNIMSHQQEALENLERQIQDKGIVVYASPAFYRLKDLWDAKESNTLVAKTNFIQASKLSYHAKFTYNQAGNQGIGFSKPERIESFNFNERITELFKKEKVVKNSEIFNELGKVIDNIMTKNKYYNEIYFRMIKQQRNEQKFSELQIIFRKINTFLYLTNTTLIIGINNKNNKP